MQSAHTFSSIPGVVLDLVLFPLHPCTFSNGYQRNLTIFGSREKRCWKRSWPQTHYRTFNGRIRVCGFLLLVKPTPAAVGWILGCGRHESSRSEGCVAAQPTLRADGPFPGGHVRTLSCLTSWSWQRPSGPTSRCVWDPAAAWWKYSALLVEVRKGRVIMKEVNTGIVILSQLSIYLKLNYWWKSSSESTGRLSKMCYFLLGGFGSLKPFCLRWVWLLSLSGNLLQY